MRLCDSLRVTPCNVVCWAEKNHSSLFYFPDSIGSPSPLTGSSFNFPSVLAETVRTNGCLQSRTLSSPGFSPGFCLENYLQDLCEQEGSRRGWGARTETGRRTEGRTFRVVSGVGRAREGGAEGSLEAKGALPARLLSPGVSGALWPLSFCSWAQQTGNWFPARQGKLWLERCLTGWGQMPSCGVPTQADPLPPVTRLLFGLGSLATAYFSRMIYLPKNTCTPGRGGADAEFFSNL